MIRRFLAVLALATALTAPVALAGSAVAQALGGPQNGTYHDI